MPASCICKSLPTAKWSVENEQLCVFRRFSRRGLGGLHKGRCCCGHCQEVCCLAALNTTPLTAIWPLRCTLTLLWPLKEHSITHYFLLIGWCSFFRNTSHVICSSLLLCVCVCKVVGCQMIAGEKTVPCVFPWSLSSFSAQCSVVVSIISEMKEEVFH